MIHLQVQTHSILGVSQVCATNACGRRFIKGRIGGHTAFKGGPAASKGGCINFMGGTSRPPMMLWLKHCTCVCNIAHTHTHTHTPYKWSLKVLFLETYCFPSILYMHGTIGNMVGLTLTLGGIIGDICSVLARKNSQCGGITRKCICNSMAPQ